MSKVLEVNLETGEEVLRDMTAEELAAKEAFIAQQESLRQAQEAEAAAKAEAKASALAKLSALGLTEEEVSAIIN